MGWRRFQLLHERPEIRNVNAHRIEICRSRWSVGRGETPAVGDDPEARCERLYLGFKGVQIPQPAMNEDERLPATALQIVERRIVERLDAAAIANFSTRSRRPAAPTDQLLTRVHLSTIGVPATSPAMCQVSLPSVVHWNVKDLPLTTGNGWPKPY
jgi:hypothetical protein